ncbi:response regulator transcription factor [Lichenicoccus sp.]|uniref:response regulator transcription factor n=1 Tax=Lichenicoccus sp. TaxID=2781899 RepID=UPI003D112CCD
MIDGLLLSTPPNLSVGPPPPGVLTGQPRASLALQEAGHEPSVAVRSPQDGLAPRIEQQARSLAGAYAARHADAGRERVVLEAALYRFSRILLGLGAEDAEPHPGRPAVRSDAAGRRLDARHAIDRLTKRQRQVMVSVLAGRPNKIIAVELKISQRTVENHRAAVMAKTGSRSLPGLARMALIAGIESEIGPEPCPAAPARAPHGRDAARCRSAARGANVSSGLISSLERLSKPLYYSPV